MVTKSKKVSQYTNHIAIAVDGSGSMSSLRSKVVSCFDQLISDLRENSRLFNQETRVSVYIFDSDVEVMAFDTDVERLPSIKDFYFVRGNTALATTMNVAIDDLKKVPELYTDHAFLLYVLTDGADNNSTDSDKRKLTQFLNSRPNNWTIAAHVPNSQGVRYMESLGLSRENIQIWELTERGMEKATELATSSIKTYMQNRSLGIRSTDSFYASVDVSNLNANTVKQQLEKINQRKVKIVQNTHLKAVEIRDLVESALPSFTYTKGCAFYEIVKKETIQAGKEVLIRDKKDGVVYGGDEARKLIGIPQNKTCMATPAFSADYEIYIQSTSVNRNVIPKQRVLVLT